MYGKSLREERTFGKINTLGASKIQSNGDLCVTIGFQDDVQDPSVHPWGGLTTTKDEKLTLLDCYLYSKSLKGLQKVFDSARARERERELLYPDACGGEGRGWISQGLVGYGRGHGPRDSCALHNARLSVDTLVDFWTALGEETRQSLLRMKEEDFMERLMYRFDSKRFCRDCRRNVIREFKELKELKRIRKEPRCTSWFCVADTCFYYEVSHDTVRADWHHVFVDSFGTYHHFEWAIGTGEGKSDILEFENVGLSVRVQVNGLDLTGLNSCYITLRAWKLDGRCTELCVKAHSLKGQQCVHCRLAVGDGCVTITKGENIRSFFEHAEEAEEEEDDDPMDKDGNDLDGECSRPQKHAKSPELAREFLLDAATVIFKEQVEKAFRDGTTRQNAHSIFVSLSLKLLEEQVHIACKDIITLEKQTKLLEEEEKEKREEEERKERRRAKEREKKLRRKERLRGKEKDREKKISQSEENHTEPPYINDESMPAIDEEDQDCDDNSYPTVEDISIRPKSPQFQQNLSDESRGAEFSTTFSADHTKFSLQKTMFHKEYQTVNQSDPRYYNDYVEPPSRITNGSNKQFKQNNRINGARFIEKLHCSNNRYDCCSCYQHSEYRAKVVLETKQKSVGKSESVTDMSKPYYRVSCSNSGRPRVKSSPGKQVWEPMELQKKYNRSNSDSVFPLRISTLKSTDTNKDETKIDGGDELKEIKKPNEVEVGPLTTNSSSSGTTDPSMDSCSSSLSEGDNNTSSLIVRNHESTLTSYSDDMGPNSIIKSSEDDMASEAPSAVDLNPPASCNPMVEMVAKPPPPPMIHHHQQPLHFPIFQPPPPMGYYHHHTPVSWPPAGPANAAGLVPIHHPNHHYVFTSPFGYDMNGNSHFVQYNAIQHLAAPPSLINPSQVRVYQPVAAQTKPNPNPKPKQVQESGSLLKGVGQPNQGQNGNFENPQKGNTGFSLFHFGGPVALSNGSTKEGSNVTSVGNGSEGENACNKDAVEEYNLFAASNGMRFSFF
jgi:hypothetical protein